MSEPSPSSGFRDRTRQKVVLILQDAAGEPPLSVPLELREVGPNASATLCVRWRCHPHLPDPDDCERAILELLYLRGLTRHRQIIEQLQEHHGLSTIERRLERLTDLGVITRSRKVPRGYDLDPVLRLHAASNPAESA